MYPLLNRLYISTPIASLPEYLPANESLSRFRWHHQSSKEYATIQHIHNHFTSDWCTNKPNNLKTIDNIIANLNMKGTPLPPMIRNITYGRDTHGGKLTQPTWLFESTYLTSYINHQCYGLFNWVKFGYNYIIYVFFYLSQTIISQMKILFTHLTTSSLQLPRLSSTVTSTTVLLRYSLTNH